MARYELAFRKSVVKDLRAFPKQDAKRIMQRIRHLRTIRDRQVARSCLARKSMASGKRLIE
jgi:hypothetical protein